MEFDKILLSKIRKAIPNLIAEELCSVQPIPDLPKDFFNQPKQKFYCSCGKLLLETRNFNESEFNCICGKKWKLKPIDDLTKLLWKWEEIK